MMQPRRRQTLVGLGPSEDELTDSDIFESDGVVKRMTVTVPPPPAERPSDRPSAPYSIVAPRFAQAERTEVSIVRRLPRVERPIARIAIAGRR